MIIRFTAFRRLAPVTTTYMANSGCNASTDYAKHVPVRYVS